MGKEATQPRMPWLGRLDVSRWLFSRLRPWGSFLALGPSHLKERDFAQYRPPSARTKPSLAVFVAYFVDTVAGYSTVIAAPL